MLRKIDEFYKTKNAVLQFPESLPEHLTKATLDEFNQLAFQCFNALSNVVDEVVMLIKLVDSAPTFEPLKAAVGQQRTYQLLFEFSQQNDLDQLSKALGSFYQFRIEIDRDKSWFSNDSDEAFFDKLEASPELVEHWDQINNAIESFAETTLASINKCGRDLGKVLALKMKVDRMRVLVGTPSLFGVTQAEADAITNKTPSTVKLAELSVSNSNTFFANDAKQDQACDESMSLRVLRYLGC